MSDNVGRKYVWVHKSDLSGPNTFTPALASWHDLINKSRGVRIDWITALWDNDAHAARQFSFEMEIDDLTSLGTQQTMNANTAYYLHLNQQFNLHLQTERCNFGVACEHPSVNNQPFDCKNIHIRTSFDDGGGVGSNPVFFWYVGYAKLEAV